MSNCNNFIKRVIGVTRTFKWTITTNGAAVPLVAEDLTLQLVPPRGEAVSLPFDVDDNVVSFTWQGEDQHIIGCYSLILWANFGEDNQRRVDIHNFVELIPWSDRQSGEYSDLIEETIELETADFGENIMVVDNLNSTSATDALSANMGRQLNVTKQDVIQDLAAIRSGAAAGAAVKEWAKNDPLITDDATQVSASKLAFNGNIFEQWVPGIASSIGLKGIAGFLKLADISQWDSAYNDRMLPTVAAVKAKLQAVLTALATIEAVIPSQASSTNKLTDKDYVDGAIATNTANFVGTFDTLAELQAVQNPTKNDYGFVIEQDAQGNEYYDRYKYTGTQWLYEYKVESTPFTTEQWAAIQSGITAALVTKLSALPTNAELNTALAAKQPVINDLTTIRSGAAAGATAYQKPSGGIPASDMASAVQATLKEAETDHLIVGDKQYNSSTFSGLGRINLEKNIVSVGGTDKNVLTQAMMNAANTIYKIQYDYDLNGQTITVPAGSTLSFEGGGLSNGTITGNGTLVTGAYAFNSINFAGTFINESFDINDKFTGTIDFYGILRAFSGAKINLYKDITITTHDDGYIGTVNLNGYGHTVKVVELRFSSDADIRLENCIFDASLSTLQRTDEGFLNIIGNGDNNVTINNCSFIHIQDGFKFSYLRNVKDILIDNSTFTGDFTNEGTPGGYVIFTYGYVNSCVIKNTTIQRCSGIGIGGIGQPERGPVITNCVMENLGLGGIVFAGGFFVDPLIENCLIKNTNLTQVSSDGATHSGINFHGYKNIQIINNLINTPYSMGLDMEGSDGSTNNRGDGAIVQGNNITAKRLSFLSSKDTTIQNNIIYLTGNITYSGKVSIIQNRIRLFSTSTGSAYGLFPSSSSASDYTLENEIFDNEIILGAGSNTCWLYATSATCPKEGSKIKIKGNTISSETTGIVPIIVNQDSILSGLIELIDGMQHVLMAVDLSTSQNKIILSRSNPGRVLSVTAYYQGSKQLGTNSYPVHLGLWRGGVGTEATNFGDLSLTGKFNMNGKSISLNNQKPNNETYAASDLFATFNGSEQTGVIYLDFLCTNGKYKLYL
jgi:hypothetical protein